MHTPTSDRARLRTRWSAIGAAVAVSLGAGGFGLANAAIGSGEKPVTITIEPERILDTRVNLGLAGRFNDATPRELQVTGNVNVAPSGSKVVVPADATGVIVNVTVVLPTDGGFLSLRPSGAAGAPQTSTVNFSANDVVPNSATVDLPANGKVQIWVEIAGNSGSADVLVDVVGYTVDHTHDDRYYTKTEADAVHNAKANAADVYTKAQVDSAVANVTRVSGISFLSSPFDLLAGTEGGIATPSCPVGQVAISGGMDYGDAPASFDADIDMVDAYPDTANRRWIVGFRNTSASTYNATFHTVCAQLAP
jgi:hypothetical protein